MEIIIGLISGIVASMGLGGGFVLLLYLTMLAGVEQIQAQGINLIFFIPIAAFSLIIHIKNGYVDKRPLLLSILFGAVGVAIGSYVAFHIPVEWLTKAFAAFILILGIKELFFPKKEEPESPSK